jgi:hypothetical protein
MSASKHTPGPWRWRTSDGLKRLEHDDHADVTIVLEPHAYKDGGADCDVSKADMALIAAAPDLLRLAKAINLYFADFDCPLRSEARAAIAKATGNAE